MIQQAQGSSHLLATPRAGEGLEVGSSPVGVWAYPGSWPLFSHTPEGAWSGAHREIAVLPLPPRGSQFVLN